MVYGSGRFPGTFDPSAKRLTRLDSIHHQNERAGNVIQYKDGIGWQAVEPYSVSSTNVVEYTAAGNNTYTPPSNLVYLEFTLAGGGGGGGGADNTDSVGATGGGGGGVTYGSLLADALGASINMTVGAAGAAGDGVTGANGGDGGDTFIGPTGDRLAEAKGGQNGIGSNAGTNLGGSGGGGSGGLVITGETGGKRVTTEGGKGGDSALALGGVEKVTAGNGNAGAARGGGGSGGCNAGGGQGSGGAGGVGYIRLVEYLA